MMKLRYAGLALLVLTLGFTLGCGDKATDNAGETGSTGTPPAEDIYIAKDDSVAELQKVASAFDLKIDDVGDIEVHRGGADDIVTLYWPQANVTKEGLQTYRVDVGDEYEDDGKLEFRVGRTVLYSEPFSPEDTVTVAPVPASVLDAVKRGKNVKWGIFFEGRNKKKSVSRTFKLVDGKKASKRLGKMEGRKDFQRQTPLTRELLKTKVLEDSRLYSEALVQYLGILQVFPDSIQPFRGIVTCCRRIDLKDTSLFTIASTFVRGKGSKDGSKYRPGTNKSGSGGRTPQAHTGEAQLALRAPSFQNRGPNGFRPNQIGEHGGTAQPTGAQPGATGPAGTGVQPGQPVVTDPQAREGLGRHATALQEHASAQKREADYLGAMAQSMKDAQGEIAVQQGYVNDAQGVYDSKKAAAEALEAEQAAGNPNQIQDLERKLEDARRETEAAEEALQETRMNAARAEKTYNDLQEKAGMDLNGIQDAAREAAKMAEHLQSQADKARAAFEMETGTPEQQERMRQAAQAAERDAAVAEHRSDWEKAVKEAQETQKQLMDLERQLNALDPSSGEAAKLTREMEGLRQQWDSQTRAAGEMKEQLDALMGGN